MRGLKIIHTGQRLFDKFSIFVFEFSGPSLVSFL